MIRRLIPQRLRRTLKFALKRMRYAGKGRFCPICSGESRVFADFGYTTRHDAQCIWCGALERHRFVWLYLQRRLPLSSFPAYATFLHIAPEPCFQARFKTLFGGRYLTADLLSQGVDLQMDLCNIPLPDKSVDLVYCSHVLEHVPDDRKAMTECRRVLADSGVALFMVPISASRTIEDPTIVDPKERFRLFGQKDHVRRYGPDFQDRLTDANFKVCNVVPRDISTEQEIVDMGISAFAGDIYLCTPRKETPLHSARTTRDYLGAAGA